MNKNINVKFIGHELNVDLWESKKHLFNAFFGEFYDFICKQNGENDLLMNNIHNKEEFLEFAGDWYAGGKDNCYALGFGFHKYFILDMFEGTLDKQPESVFIGYCHKNGLFTDFINFLITFFAWWRNDEHCTTFDPYNFGDDFFVSGWATLVDTGKLFYFTAQTVFWWQSFRVKYAIDNIPGTFLDKVCFEETEDTVILSDLRIAGYEFMGWHTEDDVNSPNAYIVKKGSTVYAELKRKDFYDYWEKEEKTIKKVADPNYKKVDPA